jgi:hypothetical protein
VADHMLLASSITWGDWSLTGNFTSIDLIAATTNALNGALLARRPEGQLFRECLFLFMPAFSLPWYAIAGAQKGVGVPPKHFVRVLALFRGWEEPLAKEPAGVYQHSDGRPLLGRKLKGKSQRELPDLGLLVEDPDAVRADGSRGE